MSQESPSGVELKSRVWAARSGAMLLEADALVRADLAGLPTIRPAVVLDDADGISGAAAEEMLLHLYNLIAESDGYLLLTGATAPARWALSLPDLTSRLKAIPAIAVGDPDDPLLAAVLVKLFADRQLAVGDDVIAYLLPRMERSFAAARKLAAAIDEASLARRRPVRGPSRARRVPRPSSRPGFRAMRRRSAGSACLPPASAARPGARLAGTGSGDPRASDLR